MYTLIQTAGHDIRRLIRYELDLCASLQELGSPGGLTSTVWGLLRLSSAGLYPLIPLILIWKPCWYILVKPLCLFWGQRLIRMLSRRISRFRQMHHPIMSFGPRTAKSS